jgi:mono/diheme cytochrome c family protein
MQPKVIRRARRATAALIALSLPLAVLMTTGKSQPAPPPQLDPGFHAGAKGLNPSERAGREIWFKATAGNGRFHTYVFQQRLGVLIDWNRVLHSTARDDRFKTWGIINDPDCCAPGSPNCPRKSLDETYGFDYCPGDDDLLAYVGKPGYQDPACMFEDAPTSDADPHGAKDQRQSACDLAFGTSTGALGFRKFPNPRFDSERWRALNGSVGSWAGFTSALQRSGPDSRTSHLSDGSVEPPFLLGMSCGACHIAFSPLKPPADPEHPAWENIDGLVGNQYSRVSRIMVSGMPENSLEWQIFSNARPGTADTSAVPNDQVSNPGTMNPLINLARRPTFAEQVTKWRPVRSCAAGADERSCWCEPGRDGKCWQKSQATENVHHILKGGEDSIGAREAVQRVYFNIGSCSEQCWVNHITDLRQADPKHRGFGQTPFDIGQCRRDCTNFRAVEDRLQNIVDFLMTGRPMDLYRARGLNTQEELVAQLDREFGPNAVARGKIVFAENCAACHSSEPPPFGADTDFRAVVADRPDLRKDFLSNEIPIPVTEVGTSRSRALHSNHMKGHVWEEYGSDTMRARPPVEGIQEPHDGGRGYYRPISLLSVWAFAPFMHNNAIGPEVCGRPTDPLELYRSPYVVRGSWMRMPKPPPCVMFDPSVAGRYKLFKASVEELLNPDARLPKITLVDQPIVIDGPTFPGEGQGFELQIPAGIPSSILGNLRHKELVADLVLSKTNIQGLRNKYAARGPAEVDRIVASLQDIMKQLTAGIVTAPESVVSRIGRQHLPFIQRMYSNSTVEVENEGHTFGHSLSPADKKALTAFLATL